MSRKFNSSETKAIIDLLKKITNGSTSNDISLSEILRLCMRLGQLLGNEELLNWATNEATGYKTSDELPDYRIMATEVRGTFHGPFGSGIKNVMIPKSVIDPEHIDNLFTVYFKEPVIELEKLANAPNESGTLTSYWSGDAIAYYQRKEIYENGLVLASAWRVMSAFAISGLLETIRTRVLEFAIRIQKELKINVNSHGQGAVNVPDSQRIKQVINNTIYGGSTNIAQTANGNINQNMNVVQGDFDSLKAFLEEIGLSRDLIKELREALTDDKNASNPPGKSTEAWLGKVMSMIGKGTLSLASNTGGSVIASALMKYLGYS